jgi:riboflavin synthase
MFTGIIKTTGTVKDVRPHGDGRSFRVDAGAGFSVETGASIAVDGVCLTAENPDSEFTAAVSSETLKQTTLKDLKKGDRVNIEPSLRVGDEIGGHFVSGHVDDTALIKKIHRRGDYYDLTVSFPARLNRFIAKKGSVALNGISLTVNEVSEGALSVKIVPHTYENTTLVRKKRGDRMNIEVDVFARYVHNLNRGIEKKTLTRADLKAAGF